MVPVKRKCLFLCVTLLLICGCDRNGPAPSTDTQSARSKAGAKVIRLEGGDWGYPTPFAHYPRGPGGFKMCLIFDSLLERDENGLIFWLAEKYEIADNGKKYIFTVRDGVKWQDGSPLTVEDVRFSLNYACRHPMTWSYVFDAIEQVETGPGNTVSVTLKKPEASMLYNIGLTRIIPRHIWQDVKRPKEFTTPEAVIGSGPFRLTHYSKEHGTYGFDAFEGFWGPLQRIERIEFIPVSEPVLAYENREIDLVRISPDLLARFQQDSQNKIVKSPAFWGYRLLFNMAAVAPLRDKRVRQAIAWSLDLDELVTKIARGAAVPGSAGILPPDHVMAADHVKSYPFNPTEARRLLIQAGFQRDNANQAWQHPDGETLDYELLCSSEEVRLAELLQQRLAQSGIRVTVRSVDVKTRDTRVRNQAYQLAIIGHGGWGRDPEYLVAHFSGRLSTLSASPSASGMPGLDAPELMALLARQQTQINPEKRGDIVNRIQHLAALEVPEIPLFYTTDYNVYRPSTYDGWVFMFDHHSPDHSKLSYLKREQGKDADF